MFTHSILPDIGDAMSYIPDPNPYDFPPIIRALVNTRHRFELHFGTGSRTGYPRLVLDQALDVAAPALPAPQVNEPLPPIEPASQAEGSSTPMDQMGEPTPFTQLSVETLTPPPSSVEGSEKRERPTKSGSSSVTR